MQVFVYGTLKRAYSNHAILRNSTFCGEATTRGKWSMKDGGFPVVLPGNVGRVRGELYIVDNATRVRLDNLESNGRMYIRREVTVELDNGIRTRAWMYIGRSKFWDKYVNERNMMQAADGILSWEACNG